MSIEQTTTRRSSPVFRTPRGISVKAAASERWRKANPEKARATRREAAAKWRAAHPEANKHADRAKNLKVKYGLTPQEWDAKFEAQGRCCAMCRSPHAGRRYWSTDHDHETTLVRDILCFRCNVGLGYLEDRTFRTNAEKYLERHNERRVS